MEKHSDVLERVYATIESRREESPETSYTASLFTLGLPAIARKVGEEATETLVAGIGESDGALIAESADLLFHLMVLWAARGISPAAVFAELARREGTSGIAEKGARERGAES